MLLCGALTATLCRRCLGYRQVEVAAAGGRLSSLVSFDSGRLNALCGTVNMAWSSLLQIALALALLWRSLGCSVLGGVAVFLALWPL